MAWSIEFWPNEVDAISMQINHQGWAPAGDGFAWKSSEGYANKPLPAQWVSLRRIHVYAAASPSGRNASLRVLWDGVNHQSMNFDNDEDQDVNARSKAGERVDNSGAYLVHHEPAHPNMAHMVIITEGENFPYCECVGVTFELVLAAKPVGEVTSLRPQP